MKIAFLALAPKPKIPTKNEKLRAAAIVLSSELRANGRKEADLILREELTPQEYEFYLTEYKL